MRIARCGSGGANLCLGDQGEADMVLGDQGEADMVLGDQVGADLGPGGPIRTEDSLTAWSSVGF